MSALTSAPGASKKWKRAVNAVKIQNSAVRTLAASVGSSTFFESDLPISVTSAVDLLNSPGCTEDIWRFCLKLGIANVSGSSNGGGGGVNVSDLSEGVRATDAENGWDLSNLTTLVTGLTVLFSKAVSQRTKLDVVKSSLSTMGVPKIYAKEFVEALRGRRFDVEEKVKGRMMGEGVSNFRWRVDVTISTDSLGKVFKPCILAEMTLTGGKIKTFEIPVSSFHTLRYNVAKVLREMEEVERHPIMRLAFEADKKLFEENGGEI